MVDTTDIMLAIDMLTDLLPTMRASLHLTQQQFAGIIGISRQSVIGLEHKNQKITRAILIAMIAFFSMQEPSAVILYEKKFYNLSYVRSLGFTPCVVRQMFEVIGEGQ